MTPGPWSQWHDTPLLLEPRTRVGAILASGSAIVVGLFLIVSRSGLEWIQILSSFLVVTGLRSTWRLLTRSEAIHSASVGAVGAVHVHRGDAPREQWRRLHFGTPTLALEVASAPRGQWRHLRFAIPAFALGVAGALLGTRGAHHGPPSSKEVHAVPNVPRDFESEDAEVALALPEGTRVHLDPRSQVRLKSIAPEEIRFALGKGSARFEVDPRYRSRLVVDADGVEVRAATATFLVTRIEKGRDGGGSYVAIAVDRGTVEVRDHNGSGEAQRLHAGEQFSLPSASR